MRKFTIPDGYATVPEWIVWLLEVGVIRVEGNSVDETQVWYYNNQQLTAGQVIQLDERGNHQLCS